MAGKDITEKIPVNIGNPGYTGFWVNNAEEYDVAIGGYPFLLVPTDMTPYQRETAQYRKDQFDNGKEPGEQSLTGWWLRSQSSFHNGAGIKFYDSSSGESIPYRYADSQGVNVWKKGQATLLHDTVEGHVCTGQIRNSTNGRPYQYLQSIQWGSYNGALLHDEMDIDKVYPPIYATVTNKVLTSNVATLTTANDHGMATGMSIIVTGVDATFNGTYTVTSVPTSKTLTYSLLGTDVTSAASSGGITSQVTHFVDYNTGTSEPVHAVCNDGVYAYFITNNLVGGTPRLHFYKKPLTGDATTGTATTSTNGDCTLMFTENTVTVTNAVMKFVKDRIVLCVNNKVYEIAPNATVLPTPVYTNPNTNYVYTSIAASGPAIYTSGYSGIYSTIHKYELNTSTGSMPTLSQAIVAAEFPAGEKVFKLFYYLGKLLIGTNKGVRVATVDESIYLSGSITYGPIIVETAQTVYDFAGYDRFVWATTGIGVDSGLVRIDLSSTIEGEELRYAYANDLQFTESTPHKTVAATFAGDTNTMLFATAHNGTTSGHVYAESTTTLRTSGYIKTGFIRFGTLEPKNFKFIRARGVFTKGSMDIESIDEVGNFYSIITYNSTVGNPEAATTQPEGSQEYISFKFTLSRDASDVTSGPTFKGYQVKALPATERSRLIQFPVWCYDVETDRNGVITGYDGRAWERIQIFESLEKLGDIVNVQDFTTGERVQAIIEKSFFVRKTPPSGAYSGFGGVLNIIVRTV